MDWPLVKELFAEAMGMSAAERVTYLDLHTAGQAELRAEVESLLAAHDAAGLFMERPAIDAVGLRPEPAPPVTTAAGRIVGAFRLLEPLGRGGMGVVYRAERADGEFSHQVAIKIVDVLLRDSDALARFRIERQILASLHHPNIVSFIDGGMTGDGQAFLVMELIDGSPISTYCRDRQLSLDDRLLLLEQVARAVQHAHQLGVVHRDLKPANILVTADGVSKVLDFGVAKLVAEGGEADATVTGLLRPMTPDYASPEQLRGLPVTTATDIYALGVVIYEIVVGRRPYETSRQTLDQILDLVATTDPVRPSQALAAARERLPYEARRLRGDLDAIVLKAMHKDPARRYASAQELADDLARYRASKPVLAREPSFGYLLARAAKRRMAATIAIAASLVVILVALGVTLVQMRRVTVERNRAEARFDDARKLANSLIFKIHDGVRLLPGSITVRKMIVAEALTYLERLSQDPAGNDALRIELATGYQRIGDVQGNPSVSNLGDRDGAQRSYRRAIDLLTPIATGSGARREAALQLTSIEMDLAGTTASTGNRTEGLAIAGGALARSEALVRDRPADRAGRSQLAAAHFSMANLVPHPEALPHWQQSLALYEALLAEQPQNADQSRNVALIAKYLGAYHEVDGNLALAREHYSRAKEIDDRRLAENPNDGSAIFDAAIDVSNVAGIDWKLGRLEEAAAEFERSLAMRERLMANDPKDALARTRVSFAHGRLRDVYHDLKRLSLSLEHARKSVEVLDPVALDVRQRSQLFVELERLGRAQQASGAHSAGCETYARASRLWTQLNSGPPIDATIAAQGKERYTNVAKALAGCQG